MIELSKAPINKSQLLLLVVNHDVVGLHISMHNSLAVTVVKCLKDNKKTTKTTYQEDLENIIANIVELKLRIENLEIMVIDPFKNLNMLIT